MSIFLTLPHSSRPWWQRGLVWLRNLAGWIVPATDDALDQRLSLRARVGMSVYVSGAVATQLVLWAYWAQQWEIAPLWLTIAGSLVLHFASGAIYHGALLRLGLCRKELPPALQIRTILQKDAADRRRYLHN